MKRKKLLSLVLALILVATLIPARVLAEPDSLNWTLDDAGTLTITGTGEMHDIPWSQDAPRIKTVIIENGVTSIGNNAFSRCSSLESVTIPASVTSIGRGAFGSCRNIKSLYISDIAKWCGIAFEDEYSTPLYYTDANVNLYLNGKLVEELIIPSGVTKIPDFAFVKCGSITSIKIPASVTSIGPYAFDICTNLKSIYYDGSKKDWDEAAKDLGTIQGSSPTIYCRFSVTVSANPVTGGIVTGAGNSFDPGSEVTITATANDGYVFANWTDENGDVIKDKEGNEVGATYTYNPTADQNLTANFKKGYKISVSANTQEGGTVEGADIYDPDITTKVKVKAIPNEGYEFVNWTENGTVVSDKAAYEFILQADRNLVANFRKKTYTITFVNEDGTVLQSIRVEYGKTPEYEGEDPTKEADAYYSYSFAGWDMEIVEVTGDATYTATYNRSVNKYVITFVDEDGTVLQSIEVEYGKTPEYEGDDPTKESDAQYMYTFAGWQMSNGPVCENGSFPAVNGDTTYTATYTRTLREYEIKFVDEEGKVLQTDTLTYGEVPKYNGETPSKEPDAQYTYTFGWKASDGKVYGEKDTLPAVGGDETYTVSFSETVNEYEITFKDEEGKELQSSKLAYGEIPKYSGETPSKEADAQYTYTFGWKAGDGKVYGEKDALPAVGGDATYTVSFSETVNKYEIKFVDEEGKELQSGKVAYGDTPSYTGEAPTKDKTAQYTYTFAGWNDGTNTYGLSDTIPAVKGDATYTVVFDSTINEYEIKFMDEKGNVLQSGKVAYGETPEYKGTTPTKEATAQFTYPFVGWEASDGSVYNEGKSLPAVTGDATYKAVLPALPKINYTSSQGSEINWTQGSSDGVAITIKRSVDDANCFSHYLETLIDKTATNVSAESGSTIITISAETLEKLSVGEHTILVKFDDGEAEIKLTIKAKPAENNTPSKGTNTGDNSHPVLWISLMSLSMIGIGAAVKVRKKRID